MNLIIFLFLDLLNEPIWMPIYVFIPATNLSPATSVASHSHKKETWMNTGVLATLITTYSKRPKSERSDFGQDRFG